MLNGTNFKVWKEAVEIVLGCMDLDLALRTKQPHKSKVWRDIMVLMLLGILTRFLQSQNQEYVSFTRDPMDSWIEDKLVHPSMSRYSRFIALVKSGIFSSLVQPEKWRTLRELRLDSPPKLMLTRLVQFRKLKKAIVFQEVQLMDGHLINLCILKDLAAQVLGP